MKGMKNRKNSKGIYRGYVYNGMSLCSHSGAQLASSLETVVQLQGAELADSLHLHHLHDVPQLFRG